MPFTTVDRLKDPKQYKTDLKSELGKIGKKVLKFDFIDNFPFRDKPGPLLLIGHKADLTSQVVAAGGVKKAKGSCSYVGENLAFEIESGAFPPAKLKEVLKGTSTEGDVVAAGGPAPGPEEAAVRARLGPVTKVFDQVKAQFTDEERKAYRVKFGAVDDKLEARDYAAASAKVGEIDAALKADIAAFRKQALLNQARDDKNAAKVEAAMDEAAALKRRADALAADLVQQESRLKPLNDQLDHVKKLQLDLANLPKAKQQERRAAHQQLIVDANKKVKAQADRIEALRAQTQTASAALASGDPIARAKAKDLMQAFLALNERSTQLNAALREVERLQVGGLGADAGGAIEAKVGEMADAAEWQKQQIEAARQGADVHGSGRHGAQQGMDRAARRAVTGGFGADSPNNPAGVTQHTRQWTAGVPVEYSVAPDGKISVTNKRDIVKTIVDEQSNYCRTFTQSMFANPVLEKQAVQTALAIARDQCPWTHVDDGGWKELKTLVVWVPKPRTGPGYGYELKLVDQSKQLATADADALIRQFETGAIKTIDALLARLNVALTTNPADGNGRGGVKMIPHAKVVLERGDVNTKDWVSKTHFPDNSVAAQAWSIGGKRVRTGAAGAQVVAPAVFTAV